MDAGVYSDGTANGNKQITGLATAIPITTTSGVYGGIDRATAVIWRTVDVRCARRRRQRVAVGHRHAGHVDDDPADAQLRHDAAVARPRLRRLADHVARSTTRPMTRPRSRSSARPTKRRSENWASARSNTSAAASAPRSCSTAASARTCRPTPHSASTPTRLRLRYHPSRNFDKLFEGDGQHADR